MSRRFLALWAVAGFCAGFAAACKVNLDDRLVYSCTSSADCAGEGFTCTAPEGGAGYCCKKTGDEQCNGIDDDCAPGTIDGATQCGVTTPNCCVGDQQCYDFMNDRMHCGGCGAGNVCSTTLADRCTGGNCACGSGGPCAAGQRCSGGMCICDATSCTTGCCQGNVCQVPGTSQATCGPLGGMCQACGTGQRCLNRACVCDSTSCPNGCCNGDVCVPYASQSNGMCGTNGAACNGCSAAAGRTCNLTNGQCQCGPTLCAAGCCQSNTCVTSDDTHCGVGGVMCSAACGAGRRCVTGNCVCDATSCPNGCCNLSGQCIPYASQGDGQCGTGGAMCGICQVGQDCNAAGACVCNAASCPTGCCDGNTCRTGNSNMFCGTGGNSCSTCGTGQLCNGGTRICTCGPGTGCTGCCTGNTCTTRSATSCGADGAACNNCGAGANSCTSAGVCQCTTNNPSMNACTNPMPICGAGGCEM